MTQGIDSEHFEKALTELCKLLDYNVMALDFDYDRELVTIKYWHGDKIVNVAADSDTSVVRDVMKALQ